jgi:alginate O-acetyltransferase complex protein AlgI
MVFTELRFLPFLLLTLLVHWSLRSDRSRKIWLLLCSYAFYAAWDWRFLGLILLSTGVDHLAGSNIARSRDPITRLRWLRFSLASNLGVLGIFKYLDFFLESTSVFLTQLGLPTELPALRILLPVGISFYTFQTLSYTLDIYRGKLKPAKGILDLALYVAFFPQLVAGPIVRAIDFLPQLAERRRLSAVDLRACAALFLVGFFKKAVLSDSVAPVADAFFMSPEEYSMLGAWTGLMMFAVQLYCDFSGYSDLAVASAGLLGYRLPQNFDFPYLATNIRDFWRRWHMTLSSWVHDYLYVSLGGSRGSRLFRHRNTLFSMALIGLWHGAAWNFVLLGLYHGLLLVAYQEYLELGRTPERGRWWRDAGATLLTFLLVCLSMTLFRTPDLSTWGEVMRALLTGDGAGRWNGPGPIVVFLGAALLHALWSRHSLERLARRPADWVFAAACGSLIPLLWALQAGGVRPFIYFQF